VFVFGLGAFFSCWIKKNTTQIFWTTLGKERKGKEFGWVSITPARGPLFGPNVLPIFYHIFLLQYGFGLLYRKNTSLYLFDRKAIWLKHHLTEHRLTGGKWSFDLKSNLEN
jgi:hypothetical protein